MSVPGEPLELVRSVLAQARAPHKTEHRPWPLPKRPWIMAQSWRHLLFCHWPVPAAELESAVPTSLPVDTYEGQAWVAVTPFEVRALRLHGTAPIPLVSSFLETNVRTYVTVEGKPGIYFFSLDAESRLAVAAARRFYRLPYFPARMSMKTSGELISYSTRRTQADAPPAELVLDYAPTGPRYSPAPGTLQHWLTERYCLYTMNERQEVLRGEIHHPPWQLQEARAEMKVNTMLNEIDLTVGDPPLLHYAQRQDVVFWRLSGLDRSKAEGR